MDLRLRIFRSPALLLLSILISTVRCEKQGGEDLLPFLLLQGLSISCSEERGLPCLELTEVVGGLDQPIFAHSPPGDTQRLFLVEQGGKIRIWKEGSLLPFPFLDLGSEGSDLISFSGERGLLGMAFHPDYENNGRFWVNYTRKSDGDTVIAEYVRSSGNADLADADPVQIVFTVDQPFSNHNGGMIAFGSDGYLYIAMGDGGGTGDPNHLAQNLESALGKILRIDVDMYPTPVPGNRTVTGGENPHVWDWGLRNPWRFGFDRSTGDLYIGDVGQNAFEEINIEGPAQGLKNYGWRITEGNHCFHPSSGCDSSGLTLPKLEYDHSIGTCVTGGYVYRGSEFPSLYGRYFYGDFVTGRLWSFVYEGGVVRDRIEHTGETGFFGNISSFGEDSNGELYLVDYGGRILRIRPRG